MNVTSKLESKVSRTALKSVAVAVTLLTLGVGGAAAQPGQAVNLVTGLFWTPGEVFRNIAEGVYYISETYNNGLFWTPGEVFRNIAEGVYYVSETFGNGLLFEGPDLFDVDVNFSLF